MSQILKLFVIGSSIPVCFLFYLAVNFIKNKNYNYFEYSIICPIFFGITNVISYYLSKYLLFNNRTRFILTSLITFSFSLSYVKFNKSYNFSNKEWNIYYIILFLGHFFVWNIIIYNLEKYIN